jgi:GrpB-like predicted nucleotidyltransferase (UPF0157 family)
MDPQVVIVDADPAWPARFALLEERLRACLGDLCLGVEHIGSTSVPGLAAKDKIDAQVVLADVTPDVKPLVDAALARGGFQATREATDHRPAGDTSPGWHWEKLYLRGAHPALPFRSNIHLRARGRLNREYALLFRDYLRAHPASAEAYARLKRELARRARDVDDYVEMKDPACDLIYLAARAWAAHVAWRVVG